MSNEAEMPRRLRAMPGVGPITALAVETFAPPMDQFRRGRDFAACSASSPSNIPRVASRSAGRLRRWDSATSGDCRSPAPWP